MATERHNAIKRHGQFPTDDDRLAECFGRVLNAAYQIDRGTNDREIEPIGSADIPVMDRAELFRPVRRARVAWLDRAADGDRETQRHQASWPIPH
jgi:hypothetical protein